MGRGKSKPKKITPKRKLARKKRKLPEGLRRWNQVRSFLSKENKKLGRKYNGVELNDLAKSIFREYYYESSLSDKDIASYISNEVPTFYSSALDVSNDLLIPFKYFDLDQTIRALPTGLLVTVNAGGFGNCRIKTSDYDYYVSGARDIVEDIREVAENESAGFNFHGSIIKNQDPNKKKNKEPDYLVSYILYVKGSPVVSTGSDIVIPPPLPKDDDEEMEARLKKMDEKVDLNEKKKKERRKKEQTKVEESKEERILKLQNENLRLQNEKADKILALIKAGYTKAEIKKMGF